MLDITQAYKLHQAATTYITRDPLACLHSKDYSLTHQAKKRFGQNFLHDSAVIGRIIRSIHPRPGEHLIEIGPGQGAITTELLKETGQLDAVELDRDLIHPLAETCANLGELTLYNSDAMKFDFAQLAEDGRPLRLVGNLPYNISTPILFHLLKFAPLIQDMHFMLQKEVVDRMAAAPGSKTYGRLSVMMQAWCDIEPLFVIGPGAFNPPPKVDSAIVRLTPHKVPPCQIIDPDHFSRLVTAAFGQRRKTLRNSLSKLIDAEQIIAAGIDPTLRAERLTLVEFAQLSNHTCNMPPTA
ncbi:MAG: 16S rRNA (adenine(1518)-N(6)/adenine(1519)-N(6))-dimethyltransferase RsmA [Sedimenticola selenatireducens]|uniref:Ribosomal RNA small subunit methyltransferase A n=1 Tax=Sedimenticola selenatireducens TaxID=191960 RepID=A0A558DUS1_9GAMM|nr:16S rRNA (adenine(1518)-N(6)/adenine(1519)-N(6))-dimethyltransferase RsmA [Sedimenticola selenatireducens]TVT64729.1 MAG: 16S rRNA (adenine(1518)-N(6)/adenine(1519)-N(6))-dimethyltransferase RsmA [Sedimenticola selenatireducens]